jgi:hypothetical protein
MLSFLSPEVFSALVIAFAVLGLILAARQIYRDFKRGPRWPDTEITQVPKVEAEPPDTEANKRSAP